MMKAMVLEEYHRPLRAMQMEIPEPREHEILVRVKACGICQTDLKIVRGEIPPPIVHLPHIAGHEIAAEVVALGKGVADIQFGDVGVVYLYVPCRHCLLCLSGRENLCMNLRRVGFELPGGFAEYLRIPAYNFCRFDPELSPVRMAIAPDAIATAYHAVIRLAKVSAGQDVLVVGAGGLGLHGIQIAKLCGARVIAVDQRPQALAEAKEMGADAVLEARPDTPAAIRGMTEGMGVDAVMEFVGRRESLPDSLAALKRGGRLVLVGYAPGQPFPVDSMAMHYNEWQIIGARSCLKIELLQVIRLIEERKIRPHVSQVFPFEKINEALTALQEGGATGRIVLRYD